MAPAKRLSRLVCASVAAAVLCGLAGCPMHPSLPGSGPAYPMDKPQKSVVNIQVRRDNTQITLTNTSARDFPAAKLWLNGQFAREVPPLPIGATQTFDLYSFKNEFAESFRAGGFFSTERSEKLVLAQYELPDEMVGLIVVHPEK